jgi:hypothetical protein
MWIPSGPLYLERADAPHVRPPRPLHQGDVFIDVPLAIARPNPPSLEQTHPTQRTAAILISHPCSVRAGPRLLPIQTLVEVRPMTQCTSMEALFGPPWDGYYHLFPLPGLLGDEDYAANFRRIGTAPAGSLEANRIACLSHEGWVALQRRYVHHAARVNPDHDQHVEATRPLWEEVGLWEEWIRRGHDPGSFEEWLLGRLGGEGPYAATERKDLLAYLPELVWSDLPR